MDLRGPRYGLRLLVLGPTLLLLAVASGSPATAGSARSLRPPALSISNPTVAEDAGTAVFVVRLSRRSARPVTVRYATADISATAGSDYQRSAGSLTFERGERTKSISVRVLDDGIAEDDETFRVVLSRAKNARLTVAEGVAKILASDLPPTFTATAVLANAGTSTHGNATLTFAAANATASFTITVADATEDPDYVNLRSTKDANVWVNLFPPLPPRNGTVSGSVNVARKMIIDIRQNPAAYTVEIHFGNTFYGSIFGTLEITG